MASQQTSNVAAQNQEEAERSRLAAEAEANRSAAQRAAADQAEANAVRSAAEEADKTGAKAPYRVAAGGSVSTLRGIVDAGFGIWPRDFANGQAGVDDLLARQALVRS